MAKIKSTFSLQDASFIQEDDEGNTRIGLIGGKIVRKDGTIEKYPIGQQLADEITMIADDLKENGWRAFIEKEIDTGSKKSPFSK